MMKNVLAHGLAGTTLLALLHCSSSDATNAPPASALEAGASSSSSGGGTSEGGPNGPPDAKGSDPTADGSVSSDETAHTGLVSITQNNTMAEGAQFFDVPPPGRCTLRTSGACTIALCPAVNTSDPDAVSKPVSGGLTTLTGGTGDPIILTQTQGAVQINSAWKVGDSVKISTSGETVPPFTASLLFPSLLTMTAPLGTPPEYTIQLKRAEGVTFKWTSETPTFGTVDVTVTQTQPARTVGISCLFEQSAGSGVLPSDAMSDLTPGGNTHDTTIEASPRTRQIVKAGAYRVTNVVTRYNPYYALFGLVL